MRDTYSPISCFFHARKWNIALNKYYISMKIHRSKVDNNLFTSGRIFGILNNFTFKLIHR